ncbi:MAG: bifunctional methylenetetrahydrofolate dehydrogenase/methenyltetrahydrofolate cyclohydrolase FolD [Candidatus Micrarchaeota archaeon]|nr:bifunctional methylenetetrahydrofolate dehydrogenase/methenyltetrahydrofolate cyclohydrolase FolD [Candidatus Micrarchaeota archaeon]
MAAKVIDGKALAEKVRAGLCAEVEALRKKTGSVPCLAVVLVGENPASKIYVNMKEIACEKVGMKSRKIQLDESVAEKRLLDEVKALARDPEVNGILVQLPLPRQLREQVVIESVPPEKDVDGLHPFNMGRLLAFADPLFVPATPKGVMALLKEAGAVLDGANAVVVGRSNIVGKPVAALLLKENATVTVCHSKTGDLAAHTRAADVLVVAVGRPKLVGADMVKKGAVVIDVGTSKMDEKLVGDVDFAAVREKAAAITPVPGGVGPMTIAMLLDNTLSAFKRQKGLL